MRISITERPKTLPELGNLHEQMGTGQNTANSKEDETIPVEVVLTTADLLINASKELSRPK